MEGGIRGCVHEVEGKLHRFGLRFRVSLGDGGDEITSVVAGASVVSLVLGVAVMVSTAMVVLVVVVIVLVILGAIGELVPLLDF